MKSTEHLDCPLSREAARRYLSVIIEDALAMLDAIDGADDCDMEFAGDERDDDGDAEASLGWCGIGTGWRSSDLDGALEFEYFGVTPGEPEWTAIETHGGGFGVAFTGPDDSEPDDFAEEDDAMEDGDQDLCILDLPHDDETDHDYAADSEAWSLYHQEAGFAARMRYWTPERIRAHEATRDALGRLRRPLAPSYWPRDMRRAYRPSGELH